MSEHRVIEINPVVDESVKYAHIVYVLQAIAILPFVGWLTLFAGFIINYIKMSDVRGSWLASHFHWQIRTLCYYLIWHVLGYLLLPVLGFGLIIIFLDTIWLLYRIIKGWIYLIDKRELPQSILFR